MNNLPIFPDKRQFILDDIEWYHQHYKKSGLSPYSDISPDDLFVWLNFNNDLSVSKLGDGIVLTYTNTLDNNATNLLPLLPNLDDDSINSIMVYLKNHNKPQEIKEVPLLLCDNLSPEKWYIEKDIDSYEYILNNEEQTLLQGNKHSRQRRRINYFEKCHSNSKIDVILIDEIDNNIKNVFLDFVRNMPLNSTDEGCRKNTSEHEAIKVNLDYAHIFNKKILIIKIDEKIASVSLISYIDKKAVAINHLKVDYSIQYIFQYTLYILATKLGEEGISEMNIEQDLGIEGIRTFKKRLNPSRYLEKVRIRPMV